MTIHTLENNALYIELHQTIFYHKAASAIFLSRLIKNLLCYPMEVGLFLMVYRPLLCFLPEQFPQAAAKKAATSTAA